MTDPTITIAGLTAERDMLRSRLRDIAISVGAANEATCIGDASRARVAAERDALAAQLAEVRAKLDAAPKVCAIHSYEHGPGPCMTCGAWPPGTRELIAACRTRIAGLERAANERSAEVARLTALVAELEARPVLTHEILSAAIKKARKVPPYIARQAADEYMPHLGPVMLPAQDRAEELTQAIHGTPREEVNPAMWRGMVERTRSALASLGAPPTSPPAARPVFAWVSEEELDAAFEAAYRAESVKSASGGKDPRRAAIRAVLARLEVSLVTPVDPIALALNFAEGAGVSPGTIQRSRAEAAMRATLTAAGIPVTPEVGK